MNETFHTTQLRNALGHVFKEPLLRHWQEFMTILETLLLQYTPSEKRLAFDRLSDAYLSHITHRQKRVSERDVLMDKFIHAYWNNDTPTRQTALEELQKIDQQTCLPYQQNFYRTLLSL